MTFSELKGGLDDLAAALRNAVTQKANLRSSAEAYRGTITGISTNYTALIGAVNEAADAAPTDVSLQVMKAEAAALVVEYGVNNATADAVLAAFGS